MLTMFDNNYVISCIHESIVSEFAKRETLRILNTIGYTPIDAVYSLLMHCPGVSILEERINPEDPMNIHLLEVNTFTNYPTAIPFYWESETLSLLPEPMLEDMENTIMDRKVFIETEYLLSELIYSMFRLVCGKTLRDGEYNGCSTMMKLGYVTCEFMLMGEGIDSDTFDEAESQPSKIGYVNTPTVINYTGIENSTHH